MSAADAVVAAVRSLKTSRAEAEARARGQIASGVPDGEAWTSAYGYVTQAIIAAERALEALDSEVLS